MTLHFITTGSSFPYAYYIGVCTALLAHKGEVILWYVEEPKSKYFNLLKKRKKLVVKKAPDIDFTSFSIFNTLNQHMKHVVMFDYLAWKIVSEQGGTIMGLDSVTLRDFQDLLPEGKEMLVPRDSEEVQDSYSMHAVTVCNGSKLAQKIFSDVESVLHGKAIVGKHRAFKNGDLVWGGSGIIPYLNNLYGYIEKYPDRIAIAESGVLGGVNVDHKKKGFYLHQDKETGEFISKDVRTIPLYATSNIHFKRINEKYVADSNSLYGTLIKRLLLERVWNPFDRKKNFFIQNKTPNVPKKYRFHLLGLVHLPTSKEYTGCAFTQKNVKLAQMLLNLGHEVYLYGAEGSDTPCTKFIQTHTLRDIRDAWGEGDNRFEIGYDWHKKQFKHDFNTPKKLATLKYYAKAIEEINKIKKDDDFLLVTQGTYQRPIVNAVNLILTCEPGIGYRGSFVKYRAFESTYIQYFTYGSEHPRQSINGNYYDRVIPNYFDENDYPFSDKKEDYYLYMGRLIIRKGIHTAIKAVGAIGGKLFVAGQYSDEVKPGSLPPHCEYVGFANREKRGELMRHARAVFTPSLYLEPFCGVAAESMLCGTPVITTDFGAFTDYVIDGVNGYKCNTLQEFVDATKKVGNLDPYTIRKHAEQFTMNSVQWKYQTWFTDLYRLYQSMKDKNKKAWSYIE